MVNVDRMATTLRVINLFPERHDNRSWACGTNRCFAGFAIDLFLEGGHAWSTYGGLYREVKDGDVPVPYVRLKDGDFETLSYYNRNVGSPYMAERADDKLYEYLSARDTANELLGIDGADSDSLYAAENSAEDVNRIATALIRGEDYDCNPQCGCSRCSERRRGAGCDCSYCQMDAADLAEVEDDDI